LTDRELEEHADHSMQRICAAIRNRCPMARARRRYAVCGKFDLLESSARIFHEMRDIA
jgi:hypothetical protein